MYLLLAVLALAIAEPGPGAAAPTASETVAPGKEDKPICITKAKVGTRFKERICYNREEYARRQEEERKALDRLQRIPRNCAQAGGGC